MSTKDHGFDAPGKNGEKHDAGERDAAHVLDERFERRVADVLREDEAMVLAASDPALPVSQEEALFLDEVRQVVAMPGAAPVNRAGAVAGQREHARRSHSGSGPRGRAGGRPHRVRWTPLRTGALAAALAIAAGVGWLVSSDRGRPSSAPDLASGDAPEASGEVGRGSEVMGGTIPNEGGTYLGSDQRASEGSDILPLPPTVDWSEDVDDAGPFRVVVVSSGSTDEGGELPDFSATSYNAQWSCPTQFYERLPDTFWVVVSNRFDPPGSEPVWERQFSRP